MTLTREPAQRLSYRSALLASKSGITIRADGGPLPRVPREWWERDLASHIGQRR